MFFFGQCNRCNQCDKCNQSNRCNKQQCMCCCQVKPLPKPECKCMCERRTCRPACGCGERRGNQYGYDEHQCDRCGGKGDYYGGQCGGNMDDGYNY